MRKEQFAYINKLVRDRTGIVITGNYLYAIDRKISNFLREKEYENIDELINALKTGSETLINNFIENIIFSDTHFFRNYEVFKGLGNTVLPLINDVKRSVKRLKIWCIGCATGQEPYSIAMTIKDKSIFKDWAVTILGTDYSNKSIQKAHSGEYNQFEVQMGMNANEIIKFFNNNKGAWTLKESVRRMVDFRTHNILDDFAINDKFDIIFCRYLFRDLDPSQHIKVLQKIVDSSVKGSFLYLGLDERPQGIENFYNKISGMPGVFRSKIKDDPRFDSPINPAINVGPSKDTPSFRRPDFLSDKLNK